MENETTTDDEQIADKLDRIADNGRGRVKIQAQGESERLHLSVREVTDTAFIRIFDTSLPGEVPTSTERVIIQTRGEYKGEWSKPRVHFRTESGLTEATDYEVVA